MVKGKRKLEGATEVAIAEDSYPLCDCGVSGPGRNLEEDLLKTEIRP